MHEQDDLVGELARFVAPAKAGAQIPCSSARSRPPDPGSRRDAERSRRSDLANPDPSVRAILRAHSAHLQASLPGPAEKQIALDSAIDAVPALSGPGQSGARHDPQGGDKGRPYDRATVSRRPFGPRPSTLRMTGARGPGFATSINVCLHTDPVPSGGRRQASQGYYIVMVARRSLAADCEDDTLLNQRFYALARQVHIHRRNPRNPRPTTDVERIRCDSPVRRHGPSTSMRDYNSS